jgi:hypothetical protein
MYESSNIHKSLIVSFLTLNIDQDFTSEKSPNSITTKAGDLSMTKRANEKYNLYLKPL